MKDYKVETKIERDGSLTIKGLPFRAGERVQVIVRGRQPAAGNGDRHPLRGKPVRYIDPFGGVAEGDWEVLK